MTVQENKRQAFKKYSDLPVDFSSLKKLNTKFVLASERSRHADVIYEVKSHGQTAYIYLFLEFQSTVDRFMALRMSRYLNEFYQEQQIPTKSEFLNPSFPILIYNGSEKWDAPECLSDLFYKSSLPTLISSNAKHYRPIKVLDFKRFIV